MFPKTRICVPVVCMTIQALLANAGEGGPEKGAASFEVAQAESAPAQSAQAPAEGQVAEMGATQAQDSAANFMNDPVFQQRVDLRFKDAEFQNVIRLIAAQTGLNILLDPEEIDGTKKVTVQLTNVPLKDALDNILKTNKLAYIVESGNILRIVPEARVGRKEVETQTEVIELNWRNAKDIEETFKDFVTKDGSLKANEETQTLIVTDVPPNLAKLRELISQIDHPDRQVIIEARLVDVQIGAMKELSSQWSASKINALRPNLADPNGTLTHGINNARESSSTGGHGRSLSVDGVTGTISGASEDTSTGSAFSESFRTTQSALFGSIADPIGGVLPVLVEGLGINNGRGTLQFGSILSILGEEYAVDAAITALESRNIVEVLSNPRMTTLNNVQANIKIIQRVPYVEAVQGPTQGTTLVNVEFEDVGEKIGVRPVITPDGHVRLDIDLEQTIFRGRVGSNALDPPLIDLRNARSTVIVKDSNTVVLGGLRGLDRNENLFGVPWLHTIPVLGWLFKDKTYDQRKRELILMVTPNIVEQALITDSEKEMYDRLEVNWHLPDHFFDDVNSPYDMKNHE